METRLKNVVVAPIKSRMNIKGLGINNLNAAETAKRTEKKQMRSAESSSDRDADGRRQQDDGSDEQLSKEQVQKAISYLQKHPGVKDNNLIVKEKEINGKIILLIEDYQGKVVRRIPEAQIIALSQASSNTEENAKGQLYNRAM